MPFASRRSAAPALRALVPGTVVLLIALALYALGAASAPMRTDEFYTVLAARSYAAEGIPRIGEGVYLRAVGFTALVAASLSTFGDTLFAARLPAIVPAALLVMLAFLWTRREAGTLAACFLAAFLVLSDSAAAIAQYSRFYALHALLFFVCGAAVYEYVSSQVRTRARVAALALTAAAAGALALHLQVTTLIGLAALAGGSAVAAAWRPTARARMSRGGTALAAGLAVALVVLAVLTDVSDVLARLYEKYRWVALWNAEHQDNSRYYLHRIAREIPVLFYTYPLAILLATGRAPRATLFCVVVVTGAVALHSFGGMKSLHYIQYLWPFLLLPPAVASSVISTMVARKLFRVVANPVAGVHVPPVAARSAIVGALTFAFLAVLMGNPDYERLRALPSLAGAELGVGAAATAARSRAAAERTAVAELRRLAAENGFVVSSSDLPALWHLGRVDLVLRPSRLSEFTPSGEFARDPRTGAVVISAPASLARVLECRPRGILIVWDAAFDWRRAHAVTPAVADLIEQSMQPVALPGATPIRVFRWERPATRTSGCEQVPGRGMPPEVARSRVQ